MDGKHILIVEDDLDISRLLKLELEEEGFRVSTFETGMRGLSGIREEQPDLVILCHGGNDILRNLKKAETKDNLLAMIEMVDGVAALRRIVGIRIACCAGHLDHVPLQELSDPT